MNNSSSTVSLSSIQTVFSTTTSSPQPLHKSQSESALSSAAALTLTRIGLSESNLVLMPGAQTSIPPNEERPVELRSKVSLSGLQNQLLQIQTKQEQQQEQQTSSSFQQPLRQLQSRLLNVSSDDVRLFGQALKEYHETLKYWGSS